MSLFAILFCLALQRFANIGSEFRSSWFEFYLKSFGVLINKTNKWMALLLVIAPVLLPLLLLNLFFYYQLCSLFKLLLSTLILFFCIDARDFKNVLSTYFTSLEKGDDQAATTSVTSIIKNAESNTPAELNRAVTKTILLKSFENLFSGLFWFVVFGPYGTAFYFLMAMLSKNALTVNSNCVGLTKLANKIQDILDWIPSRLVGISYALVGNFSKGLSYCSKNLLSGLSETRNFSVGSGLAALDAAQDASRATPKENHAVLDLINRVLILWLIALSIIIFMLWL